jgi:dipeptidyl aminopeptidase/acylaminoacyl peptidase
LRLTGEAKPLVSDLHYFRSTGLAAFSVSQNGILAWRSARHPLRLAWLDRRGIEVGAVASMVSDAEGRLSPDGRRYVVGIIDPRQGLSDIWVHDLLRGSAERMTFQPWDEKNPVWAPDGTIYYRSDGGGGPPDIFKRPPGGDERVLVHRGPGIDEPHDVSPDGRSLLLVQYNESTGADIQLLPVMPPGPPRAVAATPFQELSPRFSPDGRYVAYSSDLSGRPEAYVRPTDGTTAAVRLSQEGGTRPRWRQDGSELFFLGPGGRLMVVAVGKEFGVARQLFQAAGAVDYEVAPDGTRFLVHLDQNSSAPSVHLLFNWRARLQMRE